MKTKEILPAGKLHTMGQSYFVVSNRPLKPLFDYEKGGTIYRWEVVPMIPLDHDDQGVIYGTPRHIVTNGFAVEYMELNPIRTIDTDEDYE